MVKIFNLARGQGKTIRMLYASEFNNIPILCYNEQHKSNLIEQAERCGIDIPEPITVNNFIELKGARFHKVYRDKDIVPQVLIDEMDSVLSLLMLQAFGTEISGGTMTIAEENAKWIKKKKS